MNVAALKKFGLLQDDGHGKERQARLTADALAVVLDERPDSPERDALIRQAALRPALHQELWNEYRANLPSDATLKFKLQNGKHFTPGGAEEFIAQYRATIAYALGGQTEAVTASVTADASPLEPKEERRNV